MLTDFPAEITSAPVNEPQFLQRAGTGSYGGDAMTDELGMDGLVRPYDCVWNICRAAPADPDYKGPAMEEVMAERERRIAAGMPAIEHGVTDSVEQITEKYPGLLTDPRSFAITMATVREADQPGRSRWRWVKWGKYIGARTPAAEYLADESVIEEMVLFEVHEILPAATAQKS